MKEYEIEYSTHGHWYIVAESEEEADAWLNRKPVGKEEI